MPRNEEPERSARAPPCAVVYAAFSVTLFAEDRTLGLAVLIAELERAPRRGVAEALHIANVLIDGAKALIRYLLGVGAHVQIRLGDGLREVGLDLVDGGLFQWF